MRFLTINCDYPQFLTWLYQQHPGLESRGYAEQLQARNASLYSTADWCSSGLRALGHEAIDIHANNLLLQTAWCREHHYRPRMRYDYGLRLRRGWLPWPRRTLNPAWMAEILAAQVAHYRPDVIWNQAADFILPPMVEPLRSPGRLLIGQHAATQLQQRFDWRIYDFFVSSFPPTVDWLRNNGVLAEKLKLAAGEPVLAAYPAAATTQHPVSFIGSLMGHVHQSRRVLLERVAQTYPLEYWGPVAVAPDSPLHQAYRGSAWGYEMYQILNRSGMTLNHHGDIPPFANNCRLYEATAAGTLLITDWKPDLDEIFIGGKEVVAYRNDDECMELIQYYLTHDNERATIARQGRERTARDHTYTQRMRELLEMMHQHFKA